MQMLGHRVRRRSTRVRAQRCCVVLSLSLTLFSDKMKALCILGSVAAWEGGASREGFKLLSVNVTLCYLDSNYTCQLSLSPHLSLSPPSLSVCLFKPSHTLLLCVRQDCALILFLSLFICNLPLCQSVLPSPAFSAPLTLCIHCCFNPLPFILPYCEDAEVLFPTDFKHGKRKQQSDIDTGDAWWLPC